MPAAPAIQVANDPMRRDAVEQCLRRIGAITSQLTAIDEEVIAHLEPMLGLMQPLWPYSRSTGWTAMCSADWLVSVA